MTGLKLMLFEFPIRVYIEDTDIGGIVYYVNYLKFMERARTELLRANGLEQQALKEQGYLFVVKSVACDYRASAKLDDQLIVTVAVDKFAAASVIFTQQVHSNKLLCSAQIEVVCVNAMNMKPTRFTPQIRDIFSSAHTS
ncbi:MAG: tol-pal system-associated acyl-CoA thioesterase [Oceanospirillaceae bacterium]